MLTEYGNILEQYTVAYIASIVGRDRVHRIDEWENSSSPKADLLIIDGEFGLIVEIKRTLATEVEKSVLDAESTIEVLSNY